MALVQCPDCEKMVSSRTEACPFCGCPAKFFGIKEDAGEKEWVIFRFAGNEIHYPVGMESYTTLCGPFLMGAESCYKLMADAYDQCGDITTVLKTLPDLAEKSFNGLMEYVLHGFYIEDIHFTMEQFFDEYGEKYGLFYDKYYTEVVEQYAVICKEADSMARYRAAVKESRSRWVGGGFGIKGAVKGAITAGAMNLGMDFIRSFGDSADRKRDEEIIRKKLNELYKNPKTKELICRGLSNCLMGLHKASVDVMKIKVCDEVIPNYNKAFAIVDRTEQYETDRNRFVQNLVKAIALYPFTIDWYKKIEKEIQENDENDILSFFKYWGIDQWKEDGDFDDGYSAFIKECKDRYQYNLDSNDIIEKKKTIGKIKRNEREVMIAKNVSRRLKLIMTKDLSGGEMPWKHVYAVRTDKLPEIVESNSKEDEILIFYNDEMAFTDYSLYCHKRIVPLSKLNEIYFFAEQMHICFEGEIPGDDHEVTETIENDSTVRAAIFLNIALEPYVRLDYIKNTNNELLTTEESVKQSIVDAKIIINSEEDKERLSAREQYEMETGGFSLSKFDFDDESIENIIVLRRGLYLTREKRGKTLNLDDERYREKMSNLLRVGYDGEGNYDHGDFRLYDWIPTDVSALEFLKIAKNDSHYNFTDSQLEGAWIIGTEDYENGLKCIAEEDRIKLNQAGAEVLVLSAAMFVKGFILTNRFLAAISYSHMDEKYHIVFQTATDVKKVRNLDVFLNNGCVTKGIFEKEQLDRLAKRMENTKKYLAIFLVRYCMNSYLLCPGMSLPEIVKEYFEDEQKRVARRREFEKTIQNDLIQLNNSIYKLQPQYISNALGDIFRKTSTLLDNESYLIFIEFIPKGKLFRYPKGTIFEFASGLDMVRYVYNDLNEYVALVVGKSENVISFCAFDFDDQKFENRQDGKLIKINIIPDRPLVIKVNVAFSATISQEYI